MLTVMTIILCLGIIVSAILAITVNNIISAVISAGLVGLLASITYVILSAPDVAMTEAAIGSGLTTLIFLYAINKTNGEEK